MVGDRVYLKHQEKNTLSKMNTGESTFKIEFEWDEEHGVPGAVIVENRHHVEFYLKSLTLDDVPGKGRVHFVCNSWVYPAKNYQYDRVFFSNDVSIPFPSFYLFAASLNYIVFRPLIKCEALTILKIAKLL
jgi:PLAT/LH2 domain